MSSEVDALQPLFQTMGDRVRACSDALLALRAGHSALDDVRAKLQNRLANLKENESEKRPGLRDAMSITGNLMVAVQGQLPVCEGQATEARLTHASVAAHIKRLVEAEADSKAELLRKAEEPMTVVESSACQ